MVRDEGEKVTAASYTKRTARGLNIFTLTNGNAGYGDGI